MIDALIDYIVNAVWQIPLVAIGAAVLTRVGRLSPRGRHRIWVGALVLAVVSPALPATEALSVAARPLAVAATPQPLDVAASMAPSGPVFSLPPIAIDPGLADAIAIAFGLVVAVGLIRLVLACRAAGGLVRRSSNFALAAEVSQTLADAARASGLPIPPVRLSDEIGSPAVVGDRAPVILAPAAFARLGHDEQRAALLHELAHIARRDFAVNLACEAIALPAGWHPLIYEIKAGARMSREIACDAIASATLGSRDAYARRLINLADALRLDDGGETSLALVALISRSNLEERLMQLIKGPRAPTKLRLFAATALAVAVVTPALLLHVTPALAGPTAAEAPIARAAPTVAYSPVATIAEAAPIGSATASARHCPRARRASLAQAERSPVSPAPPASFERPAPASMVEPPTPPAPPAPPVIDEVRIRDTVRQATLAAVAANRAMASAEVRRALAEARAQVASVDRQAIRRQVAQAMASAEVQRALAEASRVVDSEEVRKAIAEARQEAAKAMAEARDEP